jgi:dihydrolipoamide dehydrogenase
VSAVNSVELRVPDLGDFKEVTIVEVLVKPGERVEVDTGLVTLETDKATIDVPSTAGGVIEAVLVKRGDKVSKGSPLVKLRQDEAAAAATADVPYVDTITLDKEVAARAAAATPPALSAASKPAAGAAAPDSAPANKPSAAPEDGVDLVVLGAGPGGYTAAFRAADLGLRVTLIERGATLGGVCLNVGCIPSKALLHAARVIEEAESMAACGIEFGKPRIDLQRLRAWKGTVVTKLTKGLTVLAKQRKVEVVHGVGRFTDAHSITVESGGKSQVIRFKHCVIAAGSESARLPGLPADPRILDSSSALELPPTSRLLVIGGGIIGLEMACVYDALGVKVSVVELTDQLVPGCDADLVKPLHKRIAKRYEQILLKTRVEKVEALPNGVRVTFSGEGAPEPQLYDRVLVAVGRAPNGKLIGADAAGVQVDGRGFIKVDAQQRTNVPHIFAIGDVVGQPMLAHKASHQGKVAAEVAAGLKRAFEARVIPSVAYTDPEIAWVGVTEAEAKKQGIDYGKGVFPWMASGRSLSLNRDEGFTKVLFDKQTQRVIGAGIVGTNAGDLISEVALAIEMGCDATDIGLTVHPHPTLSETVAFAAEAFEGTLTDLYIPKKSH